MGISDWPADERPREKLLRYGAASLSDAELVAIFLRVGVRGLSAVELAQHLLTSFGSLRSLLLADQAEFCRHRGLGVAKFTQLHAVVEMAKRHQKEVLLREEAITSPRQTCDYLQTYLRDCESERFCCLFLDNRNRPLDFEELFRGTIDSSAVHPREVVRRALKHNASAVIFAHNHPSGVAEPSDADVRITKRLKEALALIDVRVLDHMVVGDGITVSLAEQGLI